MQQIMTLVTDTPDTFSDADLQRFEELVIKGGEVGGAVLTDNIAHALILAVYREEGTIFGVAALKRPKESYREKIEVRSGVTLLKADYPYELGYIFLDDSLQGRRLSYPLVQTALDHAGGAGVFATVRVDNDKMRRTLKRAGFSAVGDSWTGNEERIIGLLIRPPTY
jgi:GNAT superfamily N-acetyltransferase